jgi:primosomal protein N'
MSLPNKEFLAILELSTKEMRTERLHLQSSLEGRDSPVDHFWRRAGLREEKLRSNAEAEARRTSDASRLQYSHLAQTFSQHMQELEQRLHEEAVKLGSHAEAAVRPNVPSRCSSKGNFTLTELQRAAQRLFEPGCPPPMRRIMTELTPGMGKTVIYMEVIAKFLGTRNP